MAKDLAMVFGLTGLKKSRPFKKAVEISLKLNESDQSNGLFALGVGVFEAHFESFLEKPKCPPRVRIQPVTIEPQIATFN